jgi:hypothetical protein
MATTPMSIPSYDALACDPLDPPQRLKLGRLLVGRRKSQKEGEIGKSWRTFCSAGRFLSPVIDRARQNNPKLRRLKADFEADDLKLWYYLVSPHVSRKQEDEVAKRTGWLSYNSSQIFQ